MSTTTIRLPEDLKARLAEVAERTGKSPHSFILEAIAEKTEQEERRGSFEADAEERFARIAATGETIPWSEMRNYLAARVAGQPVGKPVPKKKRG